LATILISLENFVAASVIPQALIAENTLSPGVSAPLKARHWLTMSE
jgi:hypothetical protein